MIMNHHYQFMENAKQYSLVRGNMGNVAMRVMWPPK